MPEEIELRIIRRTRALKQPGSPWRERQVLEPGLVVRIGRDLAQPYLDAGDAEELKPALPPELVPGVDLNAPHRVDPSATHRALKRFRMPDRSIREGGDLLAIDDDVLAEKLEENGDVERIAPRRAPAATPRPPAKPDAPTPKPETKSKAKDKSDAPASKPE